MAENEEKDVTESPEPTEETTAAEETPQEAVAEEKKEEVFVEPPSFEIDYKGDCAYEVKVTVPAANGKKQAEDMFDELKCEAQIPGFRRGRAPRRLVERKFSKAVKADVENKLVSAAFEKLIEDEKLRPIGRPDIEGLEEEKERPADGSLIFTLKFEVAPKVELGQYKGVEVERPVLKIEDSDVDAVLDNARNRFAMFETLEEGAAAEGDQVIIDFEGMVDGETFAGGSASSYPYILGTKRFFHEFEDVLLGSSAGGELDCQVTFPEDFANEELRGKQAEFKITVNEVKRRNVPKLNDEFAKQNGYESLEDMREKITARLREQASDQSRQTAEERALTAVVESSKFEMPKTMVESMTHEFHEREVRRLMTNRMPMAEIQQHDQEILDNARQGALNAIKRMVTLYEIARIEDIKVTDEDFEKEASVISERTGTDLEVVTRYLAQSEERGNYEDRIYRNKAMAVIMDNAVITDKEVERDELESETSEE